MNEFLNKTFLYESKSEKESFFLAKHFAFFFLNKKIDLVFLDGSYGAGKTIFVKGIANQMGIKSEEVTSPSFSILEIYSGNNFQLFHLDCYRLKNEEEIFELGLSDLLDLSKKNLLIIEWASSFKDIFKQILKCSFFWSIHIDILSDGLKRAIKIEC